MIVSTRAVVLDDEGYRRANVGEEVTHWSVYIDAGDLPQWALDAPSRGVARATARRIAAICGAEHVEEGPA